MSENITKYSERVELFKSIMRSSYTKSLPPKWVFKRFSGESAPENSILNIIFNAIIENSKFTFLSLFVGLFIYIQFISSNSGDLGLVLNLLSSFFLAIPFSIGLSFVMMILAFLSSILNPLTLLMRAMAYKKTKSDSYYRFQNSDVEPNVSDLKDWALSWFEFFNDFKGHFSYAVSDSVENVYIQRSGKKIEYIRDPRLTHVLIRHPGFKSVNTNNPYNYELSDDTEIYEWVPISRESHSAKSGPGRYCKLCSHRFNTSSGRFESKTHDDFFCWCSANTMSKNLEEHLYKFGYREIK